MSTGDNYVCDLQEVSPVFPGARVKLEAPDILKLTPETLKRLPLTIQRTPVAAYYNHGSRAKKFDLSCLTRPTGLPDDDSAVMTLSELVEYLKNGKLDRGATPYLVDTVPAYRFAELYWSSSWLARCPIASGPANGTTHWVYPLVGKPPELREEPGGQEDEEAISPIPGVLLQSTVAEAAKIASWLGEELARDLRPILGAGLRVSADSPAAPSDLFVLRLQPLTCLPFLTVPVQKMVSGYTGGFFRVHEATRVIDVKYDDTLRLVWEAVSLWANRQAWMSRLEGVWDKRLWRRRAVIAEALAEKNTSKKGAK